MVYSDAGAGFGLPPGLIQVCETFDMVDVGPELQPVLVVKVECLKTGGMFSQVVERERAGQTYLRKMAVVIFNPRLEATFPPAAATRAAIICGDCIERQGFVVDLTKVATCMTDLASNPKAQGKRYRKWTPPEMGGRPRAVAVLPSSSIYPEGSFDSP